MFDVMTLTDDDRKLVEKLSYQSWYYTTDLQNVWQFDAKSTQQVVGRLSRLGALRRKKVVRNHNLQGAPSTVYAREDSWTDTPTNAALAGRAVRAAADRPAGSGDDGLPGGDDDDSDD